MMRQSHWTYDKESHEYIAHIAMPGAEKKDISIEQEGDSYLVIRYNGENNPFCLQPISFTYVSDIDTDRAVAELKDGVLTLNLPLREQKKIAIK